MKCSLRARRAPARPQPVDEHVDAHRATDPGEELGQDGTLAPMGSTPARLVPRRPAVRARRTTTRRPARPSRPCWRSAIRRNGTTRPIRHIGLMHVADALRVCMTNNRSAQCVRWTRAGHQHEKGRSMIIDRLDTGGRRIDSSPRMAAAISLTVITVGLGTTTDAKPADTNSVHARRSAVSSRTSAAAARGCRICCSSMPTAAVRASSPPGPCTTSARTSRRRHRESFLQRTIRHVRDSDGRR